MGKLEIGIEADIREQHKEFLREGHNGYKRRSILTTMQDLENRRYRRLWNCRMRASVIDWNNGNRFN